MFQVLGKDASFVGHATVRGKLYDLGEYPGLKLSKSPADRVHGELYALRRPAETLRLLDDYEGCGPRDPAPHEFERRLLPVDRGQDGVARSWVYVYRPSAAGKKRIRSGDYFEARVP